ncbi:MAG: dienelactone hydrolase family protein [Dehalococcoidia bacterium]
MASSWVTLNVDDVPMKTFLSVPSGDGPFPAVIVAQHQSGVDTFIQTVCDRLAQAGYVAAAPDLYHRKEEDFTFEQIIALQRDDPKRAAIIQTRAAALLDEEIVRDMNAALAHLTGLPTVDESSVAVTGFCMGGRVAYLMATRNASLKAAGVFYPGNAFAAKGGGPSPFAASDRITCSVIGFFGKDDENPSPDDMAKMDAELNRLKVEHTFHAFEGAGHAFMNFSAPSYREDAANDAWPKLIAFFDEKVKAKASVA